MSMELIQIVVEKTIIYVNIGNKQIKFEDFETDKISIYYRIDDDSDFIRVIERCWVKGVADSKDEDAVASFPTEFCCVLRLDKSMAAEKIEHNLLDKKVGKRNVLPTTDNLKLI